GGRTNHHARRAPTPGFPPRPANRIAQPTGTSYTDPGLPPGTYYYRVTAQDAANNISGNSNETNATVPTQPPPDPTAPSAPTGLVASNGPSGIGLGWNASTDNVGVTN